MFVDTGSLSDMISPNGKSQSPHLHIYLELFFIPGPAGFPTTTTSTEITVLTMPTSLSWCLSAQSVAQDAEGNLQGL